MEWNLKQTGFSKASAFSLFLEFTRENQDRKENPKIGARFKKA